MTIGKLLQFLTSLLMRMPSETKLTAKIVYRDERGIVLIEYADIRPSDIRKAEINIDGNSRRDKP